jgi:hypothetical protein
MNFVKQHPYLSGFAVVALIVVMHVVSVVLLALDFRGFLKVLQMANSYDDAKRETRPAPALLKGLGVPEGLTVNPGDLVSSLYVSGGSTRKQVSDGDLQEHAAAFTPSLLANFEKDLPLRFRKEMEKLPAVPVKSANGTAVAGEAATGPVFGAPAAPFREIRETARFWYVVGRLLAWQRKAEPALSVLAGVCLLPILMEAEETRRANLLTRMVGVAMRKMGATGMCEALPHLNLSRDQAKAWIETLQKLDQASIPLARVLETEKQFLTAALSPQGLEELARRYPDIGTPLRLARLVQSRWFQEELNAFYDPILEACKQPWAAADKEITARMRSVEDRQMRLFDVRPAMLLHLFMPERFFGEVLLLVSIPSLRRVYHTDIEARQVLGGAQVSMGVYAYYDHFRKYPQTLADAEQWLGVTFPPDYFSGKPLEYSVASQPRLLSVGADVTANTNDDLVFMPLQQE